MLNFLANAKKQFLFDSLKKKGPDIKENSEYLQELDPDFFFGILEK